MAMLGTSVGRWMAPAVSALVVALGPGAAVLAAPSPAVPAAAQQAPPAPADSLDARINAAIDARTKDSKLVEFEVSEAIAERLIKWAQWFGLAVGIPMAILALMLTVLGVRSYRDVRRRLADARLEAERRMAEATELKTEFERRMAEATELKTEFDQRRAEAAALKTEGADLRQRFAQLSELEGNVRAIAGRVDRLEEAVAFETSRELTPKLRKALEATLDRYRAWLDARGIGELETVSVSVTRLTDLNAYYEPGRIIIDVRIAKDPDVILREYTHHLLENLRPAGDGSRDNPIHSGLADYLPCSFNERPEFAVISAPAFRKVDPTVPQGYLRRLDNDKRLDRDGEEHEVGEGWGAAFWALRGKVAARALDTLLLDAWKTASSVADSPLGRTAYANRVAALAARDSPAFGAAALAEFARRGLDVGKKPARRRAAATA
jgi:hypothetical protein